MMQEVAAVRRAALDAVEDITPVRLRECIEEQLTAGSMVPGVLTLKSVRALADGPDVEPDEAPVDPIAIRAAGVQLIYDGLALTRELVHDEPWQSRDHDDADLAVLAADVLVARGFYLLARTEAADAAVETVRAFGRDQTVRRVADDSALDHNLERDVLELAVVAGTTAAGGQAPPQLREFAADLATDPSFSPAPEFFADGVADSIGTLATDATASEGVTSSVDD
jgi:hypothetical protein